MPPKAHTVTLNNDQVKMITEQITDSVFARLESKMEEQQKIINKKISDISDNLKDKADELEQRDRIINLRIFGVPEKKGESTDKLVIKVAQQANVTLNENCISRSHRVGPRDQDRTRAIIVRFVSYADRKSLFHAKKALKGTGISIREDLTKLRQDLLKKVSAEYGFESVWTSDGVIIVKIGNVFHRVKTEDDYEKLCEEHPST